MNAEATIRTATTTLGPEPDQGFEYRHGLADGQRRAFAKCVEVLAGEIAAMQRCREAVLAEPCSCADDNDSADSIARIFERKRAALEEALRLVRVHAGEVRA